MIEYTITLYLDSDEDAVGKALLAQLLLRAKELGFLGRNEIELED